MTNKWLNKVAGIVLAGALVAGTGLTALAETPDSAQAPTAPARAGKTEKGQHNLTPEQKQQRETLRKLHDAIKAEHEQITAQRQELDNKLQTIKDLVKELKQDPDKNRNALEKARVDLRDLRIVHNDIKGVNAKLKALVDELKAAVKAKDADKAISTARQILSVMQTKEDLLRAADHKATQAIAHLKGAAEGNGN